MKTSTIMLLAGGIAAYVLHTKKSIDGDGSSSPLSSVPFNDYGITADKTTKENLDAANAAIAASGQMSSQEQHAVSASKAAVETAIAKSAATNRAQQYINASGQIVTVGPTGNIYVNSPGSSSGSYTAGPNTPILGASVVSSTSSSQAATAASIAASISKALTGPKVSAKGKYKAS